MPTPSQHSGQSGELPGAFAAGTQSSAVHAVEAKPAAAVRIPGQQRPGPHGSRLASNSTVLSTQRRKGDLGPKEQTLRGDLARPWTRLKAGTALKTCMRRKIFLESCS